MQRAGGEKTSGQVGGGRGGEVMGRDGRRAVDPPPVAQRADDEEARTHEQGYGKHYYKKAYTSIAKQKTEHC